MTAECFTTDQSSVRIKEFLYLRQIHTRTCNTDSIQHSKFAWSIITTAGDSPRKASGPQPTLSAPSPDDWHGLSCSWYLSFGEHATWVYLKWNTSESCAGGMWRPPCAHETDSQQPPFRSPEPRECRIWKRLVRWQHGQFLEGEITHFHPSTEKLPSRLHSFHQKQATLRDQH